MYKVIVTYKNPLSDEARARFDEHFKSVHLPLCLDIPGVKEVRLNRVFGGPMGKSALYLVAEIVFETKEAWKAAMKTPAMMETGKDAVKFAGDLVSVHFAEESIIHHS